jgi:hypothetical protein
MECDLVYEGFVGIVRATSKKDEKANTKVQQFLMQI